MKFDKRSNFLPNVFSGLLLCNFLLISSSYELTILHNNDFHSHFESFNIYGSDCKNDDKCFGGVARTVFKVKEVRAQNANVLFLNAGDHFQGTVWYSSKKWKVVAEFVKYMKHDVMTLGNHEFDDGVEGLSPFIENMTTNNPNNDLPILSCNIDATNEPKLKDLIKPSIVKEINGTKIALIGYITPETAFLSKPGKTIKFNDEIESIKSEITKLKATHGESLNIFIAVGHSGFEKDKQIAQNIPELDLIVGGHSHTLLYTGSPPSTEVPADKYPVVFDHGMDGQTLVVQAYTFGKYIGKLNLQFDDTGKFVKYDGNPILLDDNTAEDPETLAEVKRVALEIQANYDIVKGSTSVLLSYSECEADECNLGNLMADSFVHYYIEYSRKLRKKWTSFPIAVINGGAIRTSISVGNITMKDIISASPFGNTVGFLKLNGSMLWAILEHSGSQHNLGGFLQVSGLRIQYDLSQQRGNRLKKVRVRCSDCLIPKYEDLNLSETYSIIVTKYLVEGGDAYNMIDQNEFTEEGSLDHDLLSAYVVKYSPIFVGLEDRIIFSNGNCETPTPPTPPTPQTPNSSQSNKLGINPNLIFNLLVFIFCFN